MLLCVDVSAQIKFVQMTDPHLFKEKGWEENMVAFERAVLKINDLKDAGADYKFVVVTGDMGVENLVKEEGKVNLLPPGQISSSVREGAEKVARIICLSRVKVWLFVPGNNDLFDEKRDTISHYYRFIEILSDELKDDGIKVINLCPPKKSDDVPYVVNEHYAFIGFNNSSFKNNNDWERLTTEHTAQVGDVTRVKALVENAKVPNVYIFYHIPEVDDPYLLLGDPKRDSKLQATLDTRNKHQEDTGEEGRSFSKSSWFVHKDVRRAWNEVVEKDEVKGLFAGHFHDWRRGTYQNYHWTTLDYSSKNLWKLYICPPLSVKLQGDQPSQARGFQEVSIDGTGKIADEQGRTGVRVFWYDQNARTFASEVEEKSTLRPDQTSRENQGDELAGSKCCKKVRRDRMPESTIEWLSFLGALCFGVFMGWVARERSERIEQSGLNAVAIAVGVVGGALTTAIFRPATGEFAAYCIGLLFTFILFPLIRNYFRKPSPPPTPKASSSEKNANAPPEMA